MTEGAAVAEPTSVLKKSPLCHRGRPGAVVIGVGFKEGHGGSRTDLQHPPPPLVPWWSQPWENARHGVTRQSDREVILRGDQSQIMATPGLSAAASTAPPPRAVL